MRWLIAPTVLLFACSVVHGQPAPTAGRDSVRVELASYLTAHPLTPEQYVLEKFKDHDVIFLGEAHRIRHDPLLVQRLIPLLHDAGINALGFEFARRVDQPLIDSLLSMPEYDENLAREIVFRQYVWWGFKEYVDIFKAAWQVDRSLAPGEPRFRILGLNNAPDFSYVKTPADRDNPEIMRKVWHGETETDWATPILDEVVAKGHKVLVYCGMHHAFTRYRQPKVFEGEFRGWAEPRVGNVVFGKIGERAMTISLHAPWYSAKGYDAPAVLPADGIIDSLMAGMGERFRRVGFDVAGTPFGQLPGETSIYRFGYDHFTLGTFCDGYIYQGPVSEFQPVTVIRDFVNEKNLAMARQQSGSERARTAPPEYFYLRMLAAANIKRRYAHLMH